MSELLDDDPYLSRVRDCGPRDFRVVKRKLTLEQRRDVLRRLTAGETRRTVAASLGVSENVIARIVRSGAAF